MTVGFALHVSRGRVELSMHDRPAGEGFLVRELVLGARVLLPLSVGRGAQELKRSHTDLLSLAVELDLEAAIGRLRSPALRRIALAAGRGRRTPIVEVELVSGGFVAVPLVVVPSGDTRIALRLGPTPSRRGIDPLLEAIAAAYAGLWGAAPSVLREDAIEIETLEPILFALLPSAGWKLPEREDVRLARCAIEDRRLILSFGRP